MDVLVIGIFRPQRFARRLDAIAETAGQRSAAASTVCSMPAISPFSKPFSRAKCPFDQKIDKVVGKQGKPFEADIISGRASANQQFVQCTMACNLPASQCEKVVYAGTPRTCAAVFLLKKGSHAETGRQSGPLRAQEDAYKGLHLRAGDGQFQRSNLRRGARRPSLTLLPRAWWRLCSRIVCLGSAGAGGRLRLPEAMLSNLDLEPWAASCWCPSPSTACPRDAAGYSGVTGLYPLAIGTLNLPTWIPAAAFMAAPPRCYHQASKPAARLGW